jgi:amino-acid N-acetyltransferase
MQIATATTRDLTRVEALLASLGLPTAGLLDQFPRAYAIATRDGEMLGCAGLETYGRVGLLRSVAVVATARNEGVGRALTGDRGAMARATGLDAVYLLTTTAGDYFRRLGFSAADRATVPRALALSPEFASACPASARCFVLVL